MTTKAASERWNDSQAWRWSRLWQQVRNRLRHGGPLLLAYVWEPQRRGVGHIHLIVPLVLRARIVELLREIGPDYGFGFVDDARGLRSGATGADAGRYMASYIGDGGKLDSVLEAVRDGVIPSRTFLLNNALSQESGVTMRSLRLRRRAWVYLAGVADPPRWADPEEWHRVVHEVASEEWPRAPGAVA